VLVLDVELKAVLSTFVAELTACVSLNLAPSVFGAVPGGGLYNLTIRIVQFIGACSIVLDGHNEARGTNASRKAELLLGRRCSSVINRDVFSQIDDRSEPTLAMLSVTVMINIISTPAGIHVGVEAVFEAIIIADVNGGDGAIQTICVLIVKDHDADFTCCTKPGVPRGLDRTLIDGGHRRGLLVIGNDRERFLIKVGCHVAL